MPCQFYKWIKHEFSDSSPNVAVSGNTSIRRGTLRSGPSGKRLVVQRHVIHRVVSRWWLWWSSTQTQRSQGGILGGERQSGSWQSTEGPSWPPPCPINISCFTLSQLFHCTSPSAEPTQLAAEQKGHGQGRVTAFCCGSQLPRQLSRKPAKFQRTTKTHGNRSTQRQVTQWDSAQKTRLIRPEELRIFYLRHNLF